MVPARESGKFARMPELKINPPIKILSPVPTLPRVEIFASSTSPFGREKLRGVAIRISGSGGDEFIGRGGDGKGELK